ncbi:lycopene cyclase domain-containing protein [Candidatus Saccharibacteria bacterium]|nr:lycopene cyclase domain-containing protein [Candidatus Saccharibacteria bacterium]
MATYLLVNIIFMLLILAFVRIGIHTPSKKWWALLGVLLLLTAVFDSVLVYFQVVGYDLDKILGVYIGYAPVEDFFYAIFAAIVVPWAWNNFGGDNVRDA